MARNIFLGLTVCIVCFFFRHPVSAQTKPESLSKVEKCLQDYQHLSAFGSAGSIYVDEATMNAFTELFETDANCYWDLFKTEKQRITYLLTVEEYISNVRNTYNDLKPVITYMKPKIELLPDGKSALAFVRKTNHISEKSDSVKHKPVAIGVNLRILFRIKGDTARIQNITEDTRLTRIRSFDVEGSANLFSGFSGAFFATPVSALPQGGGTNDYSITNKMGFMAGAGVDIRLSRKALNGWVVNVSCLFSHAALTTTVNNYENTYRATWDPGINPFTYSAFDRAPVVKEEITFNGVSIPLTVKWYMSRNLYVRAGPQFNLLFANSDASFSLSHTGGGKVIKSADEWFYLDKVNEMQNIEYGFFLNTEYKINPAITTSTLSFSAVIGFGFEARIKKVVLDIEPFLTLGLNSVLINSGSSQYLLYPQTESTSFILTLREPRFNTVGIKVSVGKMFYR